MVIRWICCALLCAVAPAWGDIAPTGREIVERVAARDKLLQKNRQAYDFELSITREKLDANNQVSSTTEEHMVVVGNHSPNFGTRSAPGAPEEEAKKASQEEPFELLNILDHYNYTLEGEEVAEGVPCYKVAFTPKPDMPYANREEKVLNAVSGHIWASTKDYSLIQNQGSLMHPVSVAWIFASLEEMDFRFQTVRVPTGEYAPAEEQYSYLVSIPFFTLHERDTRRMSNYRLIGAAATRQP